MDELAEVVEIASKGTKKEIDRTWLIWQRCNRSTNPF